MTWAKFGAEFSDECAEFGLTDAEARTHIEAIMYLYGIESMDMIIKPNTVRRWAGSENAAAAIRGLVTKGLWVVDGENRRVVHHENVFRQSLGYQTRERDRAKKAMQKRRHDRPESGGDRVPDRVPDGPTAGDEVTHNVTRNVMRTQSVSQSDIQSSYNEANSERINKLTGEVKGAVDEVNEWPPVRQPGSAA